MINYPEFKHRGLTFVMTCSCSPEQYDVQDEYGKTTAYVRLRWGKLTVEYPYIGAKLIYQEDFDDPWKASFDDFERDMYLEFISMIINFEEYKNEPN